jgi:hypothetical protein
VVAASSCVGAGDSHACRWDPLPHRHSTLLRLSYVQGASILRGVKIIRLLTFLIETTDVGFVSFSALTTRVKPESAVSPPHACPNCCRTAPRERAAATPFVRNAADLVLAPVPTHDCRRAVNWPVAQSVGSWDHLRGNPTALRRAV